MKSTKKKCLSLFAGAGGGGLGFTNAGFNTFGVDFNAAAVADYKYLTGHGAIQMDLDTATHLDLREAAEVYWGEGRPDVILTSPPCKGFSDCLPNKMRDLKKYKDMCTLSERGLFLALEAWSDDLPRMIILENVPQIRTKGRQFLNEIKALLAHFGYAWRETMHDCGELGGLAQHRRRFLGVGRLMKNTPEYLYQPVKQRVRGIGEVLGSLPVPCPGSDGGPMHKLTKLSALNWVRLALIPAGKDFRSLPEVVLINGTPVDSRSGCNREPGAIGVTRWDASTHAVISRASIQNTSLSAADPRIHYQKQSGALGINDWDSGSKTIIGASNSYHGQNTVDPRIICTPRSGAYGVVAMNQSSGTVVGAACHDNSAVVIADDRGWPKPTHKVIEVEHEGEIVPMIIGPEFDIKAKRQVMIIEALDGTWHRPMTALELAVLQGFPAKDADGNWLKLDGKNKQKWIMRIGNAIPVQAAEAIAVEMLKTMDASDKGQFYMSAQAVWVSEEDAQVSA